MFGSYSRVAVQVAKAIPVLVIASPAWGQITAITDFRSVPVRGSGHDYTNLLSETVNPTNGSVSVKINIPVPKSRGLTIPFNIALNRTACTAR